MLAQRIIQLRFAGGPHDGMRVYATDLPDTRLLFPGGPVDSGGEVVPYSRLPEGVATVYRFERTDPATAGPAGIPAMHFRFEEFSGSGQPQTRPARQMRWPWTRAAAKMKHWSSRQRGYLLAPVPPPLQVREPAHLDPPVRLPPK